MGLDDSTIHRVRHIVSKQVRGYIKKCVLESEHRKVSDLVGVIYPKQIELSQSNCLLLSPHPDDESIGCGGTLLKYSKNFDLVCLTDGRYGIPNCSKTESIKIRKNEFKSAMRFLGIDHYVQLEIEDSALINAAEVFNQLDLQKYQYIFIPNFLDQHPDHKAVSVLLKNKLKSKIHHKDLKIVFYEVWGSLALPNYFVDISDFELKKEKLINLYKSQIKELDYADRILALNKYRGMTVNKKSVEAFTILDIKQFINL